MLLKKVNPKIIFGTWQKDLVKFEKQRNKYLLY